MVAVVMVVLVMVMMIGGGVDNADDGGNLIWLWAPRDMSGKHRLYSSHDNVTTNSLL